MSDNKKSKEALRLAGKLAFAAQALLGSNTRSVGVRLKQLDVAVCEYDAFIMAWTRERESERTTD